MPSRPLRVALGAAGTVTLAATAVAGVSCAMSVPRHDGPRSSHFDGYRFFNPATHEHGAADVLRWMATREPGPWRDHPDAQPGPPPPARVGTGELRVTFVNHSTVLLQLDGLNILTDPIWSERASPFSWAGPRRVRPPGIRFEELPPIDVVLLSHNHYDHMDVPTLRRLVERDRPRIFTGLGNAAFLEREGIPGAVDLDWWREVELGGDLRLVCVPAQHFSSRSPCDRGRSLWCGFVVQSPAGNVYFAGDSGYGPHFAEIGRRLAPIRLAVLPIGAFRPRWFMAPVHISPEQAVTAHRDLDAATSVGVHFGTFRLADDGEEEPLCELRRAVAAARPEEPRFWTLDFGEGRDVPGLPSNRTRPSTVSGLGDGERR